MLVSVMHEVVIRNRLLGTCTDFLFHVICCYLLLHTLISLGLQTKTKRIRAKMMIGIRNKVNSASMIEVHLIRIHGHIRFTKLRHAIRFYIEKFVKLSFNVRVDDIINIY